MSGTMIFLMVIAAFLLLLCMGEMWKEKRNEKPEKKDTETADAVEVSTISLSQNARKSESKSNVGIKQIQEETIPGKWKCTVCETVNDESVQFCVVCGTDKQ